MRSMLLGTSKTGKWAENNLDVPCLGEELRAFGRWYHRIYNGAAIPQDPAKMHKHIMAFRATHDQRNAHLAPPVPDYETAPPDSAPVLRYDENGQWIGDDDA